MFVPRSQTPLSLRLVVPALCVATAAHAADAPRKSPRTLLRLPGWVETYAESPTGDTGAAAKDVDAPLVQAAGRPGDRTDLVPVAAANPATEQRQQRPTAAGGAAPKQTGPVQRWLTDRLAALPKPTAAEPAAPAQPPLTPAPAERTPAADAKVRAPVAATPDEMPTLAVDPASFRGALPGKTTRAQLEASWGAGEAFDRGDGSTGMFWKVEPFERVEVAFDGDSVGSIRIKLGEPVTVDDLAKQLEIADLRTVSILDEQGVSIGEVYPERGVILSVKPGTRVANAILIEPLDPESFVLRAEGDIDTCSAYAVADLEYAIKLDPRHVRAHRLLLGMTTEQGKWDRALELAETAVNLDPADAWTQLKRAAVLLALGRPDEARTVLEGVKGRENVTPLVAAQAERLLGKAALASAKPDHQAAVAHFAEAIRTAGTLVVKRSPTVQSSAREVMLDAHLGTALAIAKGTWQQKSRVIPKWIARAEGIVKDFKGPEAERQVLELQLCRGALAAAAGSTESIEPLPWVKRLLQLRDRMGDSVSDPWRRRQLDWEVGQGLADALAAAQNRGDTTDALDNATLTAAYLERGGQQRQLTEVEQKQVGELMFRIGIMHSLQRGDHATAVTWFDRTVPLWEGNGAFDRDGETGRQGECYVSMAISYWQVDRRDDAMALSQRGVELMVAAVEKQLIEERSLAVAYGNLSTMYAEEGDEERSRNYAEMAVRAEATDAGTKLR